MKIIIIRSGNIYPVRVSKEAEALADAGYKVTMLEWDRDCKKSKEEYKDNYRICRFRFKAPYGIRILFYLPVWWCFDFFWLLKERWDVLHSTNFDTFIPALIAAKIKRKHIIYDIFDFYADNIQIPLLSDVIAWVDKGLMRFADCVIIADESRITQIGNSANKNIAVITNSPRDIFQNGDIEKRKKTDNFTIFFAGGLQKGRHLNIDKMIMAVKELDDVNMVIAGSGDYEKELRDMCKNEINIELIGDIPYREAINRTLNADLLFALYDPCIRNNRFASPNKLFEAMMCGKPILVSDGTSMANIVRKYNCGIVVNCRDVGEIQGAIIKLKNDLQLCRQLGKNGRKAYKEEYSWEIMRKRLLDIFEGIM